jgi:hypothetical protein
MSGRLAGKVAVVTGAGTGLRRATALPATRSRRSSRRRRRCAVGISLAELSEEY